MNKTVRFNEFYRDSTKNIKTWNHKKNNKKRYPSAS